MRLSWDCPRPVWASVLGNSPAATFFHSPEWADVVAASGLGRPRTLLAQWGDGRQALIILSLRRIWGGLVQAARSGTAGGLGGIVATGPLSDGEQRRLYQVLRRRHPECGGSTNPFGPPPPAGTGFALTAAPPTQMVRLAPLDDLRRRYHPDRLRAVTRYRDRGIAVRVVPRPTPADWQAFGRLYDQDVAYWRQQGRALHLIRDRLWFHHLQHLAGGAIRMVAATADGELAGMLVYAGQGRVVTELYLVWDRRFRQHQVSTALKEACLADAHTRGHAAVDFMPSGGLDGVAAFKASFGAEALPISEFYHAAMTTRGLAWLRRVRPPLRRHPS